MAVTPKASTFPTHHFSSGGRRHSDSNRLERSLGISVPWPLAITDTPDIALNGLPTTFGGTVVRDDPTAGGSWDDSATAGSKFTNDLTDIVDAGTADILLMPATEAAGDKFIMGWDKASGPPISLNIALSTAGAGGTGRWMYLGKDGNWHAFAEVVDESAGLTAGTSNYDVIWQLPNDWVPIAETEIDTTERWYMCFEVLTVYSTNPVGSEVTAVALDAANIANGFRAPSTGLIDYLQYKATASASNFDTIVQIYNWTRKTRGLVTLTKAVAQDRVALSSPLYVARGDEISIGVVQGDATTEFTAFDQFMLEIAL
ncbi:MAG: hypothetical protein ACSLE3_07185 [Microbacteriaceae bacterium]